MSSRSRGASTSFSINWSSRAENFVLLNGIATRLYLANLSARSGTTYCALAKREVPRCNGVWVELRVVCPRRNKEEISSSTDRILRMATGGFYQAQLNKNFA